MFRPDSQICNRTFQTTHPTISSENDPSFRPKCSNNFPFGVTQIYIPPPPSRFPISSKMVSIPGKGILVELNSWTGACIVFSGFIQNQNDPFNGLQSVHDMILLPQCRLVRNYTRRLGFPNTDIIFGTQRGNRLH